MQCRTLAAIQIIGLHLAASVAADAPSDAIYVIAHPGLKVTEKDVRAIYLGEKELADGITLIPLDNASEQRVFLAVALKFELTKYNAFWTKKSFRDALNPPAMRASDLDVIQTVIRNAGAIGYVRHPAAGVTIVARYSP